MQQHYAVLSEVRQMMKPVLRVNGDEACAELGRPEIDPLKAIWNCSFLLLTVIFAVPLFTWGAFILFLATTYFSLLIGHSVGMHRLLIHRTFDCPKILERSLIYIGVLVGVAGPFGIVRIHDLRYWAQRQPRCHEFFSHTKALPQDLVWQLTCRFRFDRPPAFAVEEKFAKDPFYRFLERTWRLHQLPLAVLFYLIGGWPWVIWGVFVRVIVSAAGHWTVTYFCHNPGSGRWKVNGAAVQASNLKGLGLLTYGECWHNNHHAFPESARIGIDEGQVDPGWWVIHFMEKRGLAYNVGAPRPPHYRTDLLETPPY